MEAMIKPDYIFESSWEVCNKVGGIYTVLSTKARTLQALYPERIIFIGPELHSPAQDFEEDAALFPEWRASAALQHLRLRIGRWMVPGRPLAILVDYHPMLEQCDGLFYQMWEHFRVDSLHAYGDYRESCAFAYAVGQVIESFYHYHKLEEQQVVALFNEWMLGMAALYLRLQLPR
ncbi:MAG: glycosyl transferase, partial [Tannerella sp.]|nr:glycosyl transferase [Tannerella sp.]